MKNVIVTGANGFIGSALIKKLIENGIKVIALDISFDNLKLPDSELITQIEVPLEDEEIIMNHIPEDNYDTFYHFAWSGVNGPKKADPIIQLKNAEMAVVCASVANRIKCKKFLCAGTIAEQMIESIHNIDRTSGGMLYGAGKYATHLMLETYCKNIGLNLIWMQLSNIYGPENKTGNLVSYTLNELMKGNEATFGPALQPYDFIYVGDLIEAMYRLGNKPVSQNFYFIGSGNPRQLKSYLLEIGEIYGRPDLIKIGMRPDDGIVYSFDMFDAKPLKKDIGNYISKTFSEGIKYTIENYEARLYEG